MVPVSKLREYDPKFDTSLMDNFDEEGYWNRVMNSFNQIISQDASMFRVLIWYYFVYIVIYS